MLDIKRKMLITKDTIDRGWSMLDIKMKTNMRQCHSSLSMLDIKIKILLKKETMQFSLIYVGHKNENVVKKGHNRFSVHLRWT